MFKSFSLFAFGIAAVSAPVFAADDTDLFSDVRVDAVYESDSDPVAKRKASGVRITSSGQLRRLVEEAGFEMKSEGTRVVATVKKLEPWSFPILITLAEDEKHLGIVLVLSAVDDPGKVTATQLLSLMDANRKYAPSQFSFSKARKRTELFSLMENDGVTANALRDEINRLAILAKNTESIWQLGGKAAAVTPEGTGSQSATLPSDANSVSLTGRWSAARSTTEAFAIQFKDDGTFVLVYIKGSQQTRSTGKFTKSGGQLALNGADGMKLSGKFVSKSDTEFEFQPSNSASTLTFTKAP